MNFHNPNATNVVSLQFQSKQPEPERLKFTARVPTSAQAIDYETEWVRVTQLSLAEQVPALCALIRRIAIDWSGATDGEGKPLPFTDESLLLASPQMLLMIARELPDAAGWGDVQSKKGV